VKQVELLKSLVDHLELQEVLLPKIRQVRFMAQLALLAVLCLLIQHHFL